MELEPTNEKGVSYLFSIYHKELGFPEIIEFIDTTPDLTARRAKDNKIVALNWNLKPVQPSSCQLSGDMHKNSTGVINN